MNRKRVTSISKVWRRLDPAHYYDAGEVAILRAYFGLRSRTGASALDALYESSADEACEQAEQGGPIRLRPHAEGGVQSHLADAAARICLSDAQDRLPQWALCSQDGEVLGRHRFRTPDRSLTPLIPQRLLCINWADSGPGYSWPEDYYVTLLPGFARCVVTASADSCDCYGVTDIAIGWFHARVDRLTGSRRVLMRWWRTAAARNGGPWAYLFNEGLISSEEAGRMRSRVWPDSGE